MDACVQAAVVHNVYEETIGGNTSMDSSDNSGRSPPTNTRHARDTLLLKIDSHKAAARTLFILQVDGLA